MRVGRCVRQYNTVTMCRMRRLLSLGFLATSILFAAAGCGGGGALGHNAKMSVRLQRTDGTQNMNNFEIYITKNAGTTLDVTDPQGYASTTNRPNWCDEYSSTRSSVDLRLDFTTRSTQTPYFVWVKVPNTGAAFETVRFWVDVDGAPGRQITQDLTIGATQRLTGVKIDRDSASY